MTPAYFIHIIDGWKDRFSHFTAATSPAEMVLAVTLPILAFLIGIRINRYIDNRPNHTLSAKTIDILAPLISPVLALFLVTIAGVLLANVAVTPVLLPFIAKLCVAWFAVQLVMTLSSGRSAGLFIALVILPITLLHLFGVWEATATFLNELSITIGTFTFNLYSILKAIIIIIIMVWVVNLVLNTTESRLRRMRTMRASNRTLILKFMQIGLYVVVFLFALNLLGVSLTALSVIGGGLGVGIGFGLQKIASNFISGIILLFEKSIEVGDLVELEAGVTGTVQYTSGRYTLIRTGDGKDVMIPNEEFITQRVNSLTHTSKQGRIDIAVGVGYGDDVEKALALLLEAAHAAPRCEKEPGPVSFIDAFGDSAVQLKLFFWVDNITDGRLEPKTQAMLAILKLFAQHGITIPYPHQVAVLPSQMGEHVLNQQGKSVPVPPPVQPTTETPKPTTKPKAKA